MPYVLIVLFAFSDGSVQVMNTWESFASPITCSMQAFLENETVEDRTYVCVSRERAVALSGVTFEIADSPSDDPAKQGAFAH